MFSACVEEERSSPTPPPPPPASQLTNLSDQPSAATTMQLTGKQLSPASKSQLASTAARLLRSLKLVLAREKSYNVSQECSA